MRAARVVALVIGIVSIALGWHAIVRPTPPRPPLPPDTGLTQVRASGVLRVAMDASYPPFAVAAADGSLQGFDVDLARAIAAQLHVSASLLNISEDGLPDALIANQADVVISEQRPDPRLRLAYSVPYYNAGQVLLVATNNRQITSFGALRQRPVGAELGSDADEWLRRQQVTPVLLKHYGTVAAAIDDLTAGTLAAVVTDAPTAAGLIRQGDHVRLVGPALTQDFYVAATAPQNLSLIHAMDQALATLRADGALSALLAKDI